MNKGILLVISGPSGVGKGTVLKKLFENRSDIRMSVSATTRSPRDGEEDGVHYHFISKDSFLKLRDEDAFVENAEFCDNCYGTLKSEVFPYLEKGVSVILEIEVDGALQIKNKYGSDAVFMYVAPPSLSELERRLRDRGTEEEAIVEKRLNKARWEITNINEYDYIIVNDKVETAAEEIASVIDAEKLKVKRCSKKIENILN